MGLALLLQVNVTLAVFAVSAGVSLALLALQRRASLSSDALLGLLSHSALALGLDSIRDRIVETRQRVAASDDFFAAFDQATS
mgnify:CR=1 FL=1